MHTTLTRVALAFALSLPMSAAALADPPMEGDLLTVNSGIICNDRDAMVALAVTPAGDGWSEMMAGYQSAMICWPLAAPVVVIAGESIDAGVDSNHHWWALEVTDGIGQVYWLLWGEPTADILPPEQQRYEPSGWPIIRPEMGWQA